jgi:ketosteroid isomerase-like protein
MAGSRTPIPLAFGLAVALFAADMAVAAPAPGADRAAITALVKRQVAAVNRLSAEDLAATFTRDALVFFPPAAEADAGTDAIVGGGRGYFVGQQYSPTLKLGEVAVGIDGDGAWVVAEIAETWPSDMGGQRRLTLRATEVLARQPGGGWLAVAALFSHPTSVKEARELVDSDVTPAPIPAGPAANPANGLRENAGDLPGLASRIDATPEVAVFGSEASERGLGPAAAKKLLGGWKGVKLELTGAERTGTAGGLEWVAANANATFRVRGEAVTLPFRVLGAFAARADGARLLRVLHFSTGDR